MAYLRIGHSRSYCSCDSRSSVDPTATGHYENYAPDYHGSAEPCGESWDYYVLTYSGYDGVVKEFKDAKVPFNRSGV